MLQARVEEETADAVEDYADEHKISRSAALRQLIDKGLDEANDKTDSRDETLPLLGDALVLVGSLSWAASIFALVPWVALSPPASALGALLVLVVTGYTGSILVAVGASLWLWSAADDATLLEVARSRLAPTAGVVR
jgi:hypothetical protein